MVFNLSFLGFKFVSIFLTPSLIENEPLGSKMTLYATKARSSAEKPCMMVYRVYGVSSMEWLIGIIMKKTVNMAWQPAIRTNATIIAVTGLQQLHNCFRPCVGSMVGLSVDSPEPLMQFERPGVRRV